MLTRAQRTKLALICGLMTSEHDGEVLSAARKATEIIRGANTTWADVIGLPSSPRRPTYSPPPRPLHDVLAYWLLDHALQRLTEKEFKFVKDMSDAYRPTEKQMAWLGVIYTRYGGPQPPGA